MPCTTVRPSSDYSGYKASWQSAPQDQHRIRPGTPSCLCLPTLAPQVTCLSRSMPALLQQWYNTLRCSICISIFATSLLWQPLSVVLHAEGLQQAYSAPVPFQRDGLYLLHKEGHYSLSSTPLAVLWKDSSCSQYFVDTDANGVVSDHQVGSFRC